eukprot:TRINITY_DN1866_c0_g3_i1.p1 TRINITY_DN1866_c0_g3~~TRINITY_DN1866_c0_g3_i1.p1  ORF type:complete len:220 (-),score=42.76 TRINITY_DN1866_c0_g3_i1:159-731(-)
MNGDDKGEKKEETAMDKVRWFGKKAMDVTEPVINKLATDIDIEFNFEGLGDSCTFTGVQSFIGGGVLGFGFGVFFSILGQGTYSHYQAELEAQKRGIKLNWRQQMLDGAKSSIRSGKTMAKTFAVFAGIYSVNECLVAKYRGRVDLLSPLYAGCFSGAVITARSGLLPMAIGCSGFAAFSFVIDYIMIGH